MKKKILNILKYSIGLIVACSIFIISLFISANAYTVQSLNAYWENGSTQSNLIINNPMEVENKNTTNDMLSNNFKYEAFNIKNYMQDNGSNPTQINYLYLPFHTTIFSQNENTQNTYNLNLYYSFSNDLITFDINAVRYADFETFIINNISSINFAQENIINNIIQIEIPINITYIYIGYFTEINYPTSIDFYYQVITEIDMDNTFININNNLVSNEQYKNLEAKYNNLQQRNEETERTYWNLDQAYETLRNNYQHLQQQYNDLATNEYTFENLFWSVGSVPMAFLLQSFNVDVLGLNIAAIITGLITALLILWIIKKLLK